MMFEALRKQKAPNIKSIAYAIEALQANPTFLRYSIKAIALECGYTNATSFSRAFFKQTGLYPSFYIRQLSKKK
jgi:AraC-like DNA-binding protein